jgi:hypothetical protein
VLIWKDICTNKLLGNVALVLFLNKCDILERKLNAGVRLVKYVRSYGDRPNDVEAASKCETYPRSSPFAPSIPLYPVSASGRLLSLPSLSSSSYGSLIIGDRFPKQV